MKKIKIMVIEDNKLLREGINLMLSEHSDINVVAALGDRVKVHDRIRELKPDVLLLDIGLVNYNSLDLVKSLRLDYPKLAIIGMVLLQDQAEIRQFIDAGIWGFILKDGNTKDFMHTIRSTAKGKQVFPLKQKDSLLSEIVDKAVKEPGLTKLAESLRMTELEKKIIRLISEGSTDKDISEKLLIKRSEVKAHVDNILEKMSLSTRGQISIFGHKKTK